ncbi:FYVE zinc finger domain-containing protein [Ditylenchus destructor]|nr:FYVE zinc finger domain-containing protein [Ditylenchus destructor]
MVDQLRHSEANAQRITNVEACFGSSGSPLRLSGRVLVGEGVLVKMCRKKPKPRQFFLFNDLLVYGNIIISKKRYNKQHIIPLEEVKLENLENVGDSKNGWLIKTRIKSFAVYAATEGEKHEWMSHITRCVQDLLNSGRVAANDHAAVWVPDGEAPKCMCCQTTHFSVIQRRHHCRACGAVVCRGCSSKSFMLEGISRKPVRVCDTCYNKLCNGVDTTPNPNAVPAVDNDSSDNSDDEDTPNAEDEHEAPKFYGSSQSSDHSAQNVEKLV